MMIMLASGDRDFCSCSDMFSLFQSSCGANSNAFVYPMLRCKLGGLINGWICLFTIVSMGLLLEHLLGYWVI